jgi:hypothetical protein
MLRTYGLARDLDRALRIDLDERRTRHQKLLATVSRTTALTWAEDFLSALIAAGARASLSKALLSGDDVPDGWSTPPARPAESADGFSARPPQMGVATFMTVTRRLRPQV